MQTPEERRVLTVCVRIQVGPYQYYIHGDGDVTDYVNLSPDYKNPADTASTQGAKITIDSTAKWNSDMWRTELIPQTTAAINSGKVYYHFSMKRSDTNAPSTEHEHQVNFFESSLPPPLALPKPC